ncbi:hypothetical protein BC936DRAFT_149007 [Jimgerdemannia flammicorona]|uniref:MYND-type domain-containing protein n=1 Tax=Jimgerdemannia flammicorona TaxID=994334 RepID=A0A433D1S1_9FUNG|nr:hypothetical protein BC936DRAFT_149007 [Jimgerdemannia flammicorona]
MDLMGKIRDGRSPLNDYINPQKIDPAVMERDRDVLFKTTPIVIEAHSYRDGLRGRKQNYTKAMELYHKAAEMGSSEAQYNLGYLYASVHGGPVNFAKARHYWEMAASQPLFHSHLRIPRLGVALAHNALGNVYHDGLGVVPDFNKAFQHFKTSADGGEPCGMSNLGLAYERGEGTPVNILKAVEIYTQASDKNWPVAQCNLAHIYAYGYPGIVEKNISLARELYTKAAANNYSPATVALSELEGNSLDALLVAAETGAPDAMYNIGVAYQNGIDTQEPDLDKAMYWFEKAAKKNFPPAQFRFGFLNLDKVRTSVEPNQINKAVQSIRDSAQLNYPQAQFLLSEFYRFGDYGVKRDIAKAKSWREKAIENGFSIPSGFSYEDDLNDGDFEQLLRRIKKWELSHDTVENDNAEFFTNKERVAKYHESQLKKSFIKSFTDPEHAKTFIEASTTLSEAIKKGMIRQHPDNGRISDDPYSLEELAPYANTSVGDTMIAAKLHHHRGFNFLLEGDIGSFIHEWSQAFKLCDIVCTIPDSVMELCPDVIKNFISKNPRNAEARFVLASIYSYGKRPVRFIISLMDECLALCPQDAAFYSYRGCMKCFAERYQDAIHDFDAALQLLGPNDCYHVYYMRATAKRQNLQSIDSSLLKDALVDYNLFLELAPPEERKIPEALYSMAFCHIDDIQKAAEYYDRGVEAEAKRPPIFGPLDFPLKMVVESLLKMSSIFKQEKKSELNICPICKQVATKVCSVCNKVWYCSKEHQKADWKVHKKEHKREGGDAWSL